MEIGADHIIKNFDKLATSGLRKQAFLIAEAGYHAINTDKAIRHYVVFDAQKQRLAVCGKKFDLKNFKRVFCVGIGKAALEAVTSLSLILKDSITCGYVIDLKTGDLPLNITSRAGTHPYPSEENIKYTKELVALLENLGEDDLVLCVVSGGGSSLFTWPQDLSVEDQTKLFKTLTKQGATIAEINTVRKHTDRVKGGNLAKLLYPATVVSLIFSDVPADDLSMVASGPTVLDGTFTLDAAAVLEKYNVLKQLDLPKLKLHETPKQEKYFVKVHNLLLVSAKSVLEAMKSRAEDLGFEIEVFSEHFQGEARKLGVEIISQTKKGRCLLGAGEGTVTITGQGLGGRCQEMALAALPEIGEDQVLLCLASDGHDNTDAAGAIADRQAFLKARALGLDPKTYLENNDSFHFFESLDDLVFTGLTGSNVSDFFVYLRQ
jgi:glycerate-2-kinase